MVQVLGKYMIIGYLDPQGCFRPASVDRIWSIMGDLTMGLGFRV